MLKVPHASFANSKQQNKRNLKPPLQSCRRHPPPSPPRDPGAVLQRLPRRPSGPGCRTGPSCPGVPQLLCGLDVSVTMVWCVLLLSVSLSLPLVSVCVSVWSQFLCVCTRACTHKTHHTQNNVSSFLKDGCSEADLRLLQVGYSSSRTQILILVSLGGLLNGSCACGAGFFLTRGRGTLGRGGPRRVRSQKTSQSPPW